MWNSKEQILGELKAMVQIVKWLWLPWMIITGLLFVVSWFNPATGLFVCLIISGIILMVFSTKIGKMWFEYGTSVSETTNELMHLEQDFPGTMMGLNIHKLQWLTRIAGATFLVYGIIQLIV